ncbi:type II toxin-antitoxin system VapC family toxin [Rhodococcus qingshengii]|uniref:type II toxin-antitoxin system VapC family toxin n=1 Tax=Rhodococcus qingshengii TaxID=334542 RepID=UPI0024BA4038|nr:type II toxin-antitoxin system VapC family toxin [Rhodococcus qingshengii]MDJ0491448.1 type II toxin-antitoxin system VapC family toxin [Rhodococcus qingshengii]
MTKDLPRVVVDTCVLLDFLVGTDVELQKRARSILEGHRKKHVVVLPAIVVAELPGSGAIRGDDGGPTERQARIDVALRWLGSSSFIVAELSEDLARYAANLATVHNLKGSDASVLATALRWSATLYTRDNGLLKVSLSDLAILAPPESDDDFALFTSSGAIPEC